MARVQLRFRHVKCADNIKLRDSGKADNLANNLANNLPNELKVLIPDLAICWGSYSKKIGLSRSIGKSLLTILWQILIGVANLDYRIGNYQCDSRNVEYDGNST